MQDKNRHRDEKVHYIASIITIILPIMNIILYLFPDLIITPSRQNVVSPTIELQGEQFRSQLNIIVFALPFYIVIVIAFSISFSNLMLFMVNMFSIRECDLTIWVTSLVVVLEIICINFYVSNTVFGDISGSILGFICFIISTLVTMVFLALWAIQRVNE